MLMSYSSFCLISKCKSSQLKACDFVHIYIYVHSYVKCCHFFSLRNKHLMVNCFERCIFWNFVWMYREG